jgi:hypothetical protein
MSEDKFELKQMLLQSLEILKTSSHKKVGVSSLVDFNVHTYN